MGKALVLEGVRFGCRKSWFACWFSPTLFAKSNMRDVRKGKSHSSGLTISELDSNHSTGVNRVRIEINSYIHSMFLQISVKLVQVNNVKWYHMPGGLHGASWRPVPPVQTPNGATLIYTVGTVKQIQGLRKARPKIKYSGQVNSHMIYISLLLTNLTFIITGCIICS